MLVLRLVAPFVSVTLVACAAEEELAPPPFETTQNAQRAIASCTGDYSCLDSAGARFATSLERAGDRCLAGKVELDDDGAARVGDVAWTWAASADGFDVCDRAARCIRCTSTSPARAKKPDAETRACGGYASSCSGRAAGTCSSQRGCIAGSHLRWDGSLEFECKGSPSSCASFGSAESCSAQLGCQWE